MNVGDRVYYLYYLQHTGRVLVGTIQDTQVDQDFGRSFYVHWDGTDVPQWYVPGALAALTPEVAGRLLAS